MKFLEIGEAGNAVEVALCDDESFSSEFQFTTGAVNPQVSFLHKVPNFWEQITLVWGWKFFIELLFALSIRMVWVDFEFPKLAAMYMSEGKINLNYTKIRQISLSFEQSISKESAIHLYSPKPTEFYWLLIFS